MSLIRIVLLLVVALLPTPAMSQEPAAPDRLILACLVAIEPADAKYQVAREHRQVLVHLENPGMDVTGNARCNFLDAEAEIPELVRLDLFVNHEPIFSDLNAANQRIWKYFHPD